MSSRAQFLENTLQLIFRNTKENSDRLQLRDHRQPCRVGGVDHISGIDQPESDPSTNRCEDLRVSQVQLRAVDGGLICGDSGLVGLDRPPDLIRCRQLGIHLLLGNDLVFEQLLVANVI